MTKFSIPKKQQSTDDAGVSNLDGLYENMLSLAQTGSPSALESLIEAQIEVCRSRPKDADSELQLIYNPAHHSFLFDHPRAVCKVAHRLKSRGQNDPATNIWLRLSELAMAVQVSELPFVYACAQMENQGDLQGKQPGSKQQSKLRSLEDYLRALGKNEVKNFVGQEEMAAYNKLYTFWADAIDPLSSGSCFPDVVELKAIKGQLPEILRDVVEVIEKLAKHWPTEFFQQNAPVSLQEIADSILQLETPVERQVLRVLIFHIWLLEDLPDD